MPATEPTGRRNTITTRVAEMGHAARAAVEGARSPAGWDLTRLNSGLVADLAARGVYVETFDARIVSRPSGPGGALEEWLVMSYSLPGDTRGVAIPLLFMRAARLADAGDVQSALPDLELVVRQAPDVALYRFGLAQAYLNIGRLDEAEEQFLAGLGLEPGNRIALRVLADLYVQRGQGRRSIPSFGPPASVSSARCVPRRTIVRRTARHPFTAPTAVRLDLR